MLRSPASLRVVQISVLQPADAARAQISVGCNGSGRRWAEHLGAVSNVALAATMGSTLGSVRCATMVGDKGNGLSS